jgi:hypothetical protein
MHHLLAPEEPIADIASREAARSCIRVLAVISAAAFFRNRSLGERSGDRD